jgi:hypothetical protein
LQLNETQITKLQVVTNACNERDFTQYSQVFVLTGCAHQNFSLLYRLFINGDTIQLLPDGYFPNSRSTYMSFGSFRSILVCDGQKVLTAAERYHHEPFLQIEANAIGTYKVPHAKFISNVAFPGFSTINTIVQDSATGNWLIAGDFGVYSNPWIIA